MATKFRFVYPPIMAASLILALLLPAGSPAQDEGQWRLDTVLPIGKDPKLPLNALPGEDVKGWWWLPITNVNSLIQHMNDEHSLVTTIPEQPDSIPGLWVFPLIPNGVPVEPLEVDTTGNAGGQILPEETARWGLAVIETEHYVVVIGSALPGQAIGVKALVQQKIGKKIRYVIIPDVNQGYWLDWYTYGEPLTVIESSALVDALKVQQAVLPYQFNPPSSTGERNINVKGFRLPPNTDWRLGGSSLKYSGACNVPNTPTIPGLNCLVVQGEELTVNLDGLDFRFINVLDEIGGLVTYVPAMETLIPPSLFDGHLLNTAPLQGPVIPIQKVIEAVDLMRTLTISCYLPLHGFPLVGELEDGGSMGAAYLDATWTVLNWIYAYTVNGLRNNMSLDQIVTEAAIPDLVQAQCIEDFQPFSPCGEFENSLASIVKGVYTEHMGWFDGTARSLSAHVTSADKASLFLEVANDIDGLLSVAEKMTAAADDLPSIERTLYLVEPLHELALSPEIDLMYFQLLWKAGMLQTANDLRNYYLSLAWDHRPN